MNRLSRVVTWIGFLLTGLALATPLAAGSVPSALGPVTQLAVGGALLIGVGGLLAELVVSIHYRLSPEPKLDPYAGLRPPYLPRPDDIARNPVPFETPAPPDQFFGRATELAKLTERLRAGKNSAVVGPAGLGKTALAAEALRAVLGDTPETLAHSPFRDGAVFLDLYRFRGQSEPAWNNLANALAGPGFMETSSARERATEACRGRRALVILEGAEEADGQGGRTTIAELLSVLSPQNRWLILTRDITQVAPAETVELKEALSPEDSKKLLDSLTGERVTGEVLDQVLGLLDSHPLALTWAGGLLARGDEDPRRLAEDWRAAGLPGLSDPAQAQHTLEWLFNRSVRGLDEPVSRSLAAAGLLARAPLPVGAISAVLGEQPTMDGAARKALKLLVQRGLLQRSEESEHWEFTHVLGYRFARKEVGSDPALRQRLGLWLAERLHAALATRFSSSERRLLEHAAALLRTDDGQRLWIPLANDLLYKVHDRLTDLGQLDLAKTAVGAVSDWLERFPAADAEQPKWLRERSVLLIKVGDVLSAQGDLAGALTAYRESLAIAKRLAEADPSNAGWQRDLSWSLTRVAEFHERQGDRAVALPLAEESLTIDKRLASLDRSNATWQRDVVVSRALVARLRG